jgi:hypothetical protein
MKSPNILSAIAAILLFASCSKNNSNSSGSSVKFQLQTTNRSAVVNRTTSGTLQWISGSGSATEVKFEAKMNGLEIEHKSQTAQKVDLMTSINTLGTVTLAPGTYSEVEFKVELTPGTDAALELNGQFTSGGVSTPVVFKVNAPLELKNEINNVVVTDNSTYAAVTTIDLSLISRGITEAMLNSATRTGGTIVISSTSNAGLYNTMINNIHDSDEVEFEHD